MVLASHTRDSNGRLLLTAGEEITDKHIRILKAWGITGIDIEGYENEERAGEGESSVASAEQILPRVREEVDELFRYTDRQHPVIKELVHLCTSRKMESR